MFKNALLYRIAHEGLPSNDEVERRLVASRFVECGASQPESAGWVEPRGKKHGALLESVAGQWMLRLCVERKAVPGSVVKDEVEARLDQLEKLNGRRPRGKHAKEVKEQVIHELLPRAFPKRASTLVWIDRESALVVIGAASIAKADSVATLLVELLGGVVLRLLQTKTSPATAMSAWLSTRTAPPGFSVDRECELKQPDSEKSTVRYARHTLDIDEVALHIGQGKLPTQLAMTYDGRVSFVLTESLALKKIQLLDDTLEPAGDKPEDGFDTDVAIITGEMRRMLPALLEALDGEMRFGEAEAERPEEAPEVEATAA